MKEILRAKENDFTSFANSQVYTRQVVIVARTIPKNANRWRRWYEEGVVGKL